MAMKHQQSCPAPAGLGVAKTALAVTVKNTFFTAITNLNAVRTAASAKRGTVCGKHQTQRIRNKPKLHRAVHKTAGKNLLDQPFGAEGKRVSVLHNLLAKLIHHIWMLWRLLFPGFRFLSGLAHRRPQLLFPVKLNLLIFKPEAVQEIIETAHAGSIAWFKARDVLWEKNIFQAKE